MCLPENRYEEEIGGNTVVLHGGQPSRLSGTPPGAWEAGKPERVEENRSDTTSDCTRLFQFAEETLHFGRPESSSVSSLA